MSGLTVSYEAYGDLCWLAETIDMFQHGCQY